MDKDEIRRWLSTLTKGTKVYIGDDGMTLRSTLDPDAYLEVGGHTPDDEEESSVWRTKHFDSEQEAMDWIESRDVRWNRIFVDARMFSIEWKSLRVIQFEEDE